MKYKVNRDDNPAGAITVTIYIGLERFRISESIEGRMEINKMSDGISDNINIHPCVANVIQIS